MILKLMLHFRPQAMASLATSSGHKHLNRPQAALATRSGHKLWLQALTTSSGPAPTTSSGHKLWPQALATTLATKYGHKLWQASHKLLAALAGTTGLCLEVESLALAREPKDQQRSHLAGDELRYITAKHY